MSETGRTLNSLAGPAVLRSRAFRLGPWAIPYSVGVFLVNLTVAPVWWLFGPYSNFSPIGYLDPWFYTGYFTHFNYIVAHYGATYYVSRLPWILPGLLAYKIATPLFANAVLNTLILACCTTSLYWIVN